MKKIIFGFLAMSSMMFADKINGYNELHDALFLGNDKKAVSLISNKNLINSKTKADLQSTS